MMHNPDKRAFLVKVLRDYLDRGVPINGVGLQSHVGLTYPDLAQWERSIATYADMGLKVHITELDVDVLPPPSNTGADVANRATYSRDIDPWPQGLPDDMQEKLADRYEELFRILLRYRKSVERVTFWGLHDGISWKNDFPVRGRTNYPLLFDRDMKPKPAYHRVMKLAGARGLDRVAGQPAIDQALDAQRIGVAQLGRQQRVRIALITVRPRETQHGCGSHRSVAHIGGGRIGPSMVHGRRNFHTGGKTIDEQSPGAALGRIQQGACLRQVFRGGMKCRRELPFQRARAGHHLLHVVSENDQSEGPEGFGGKLRIGQKSPRVSQCNAGTGLRAAAIRRCR